MSNSWGNRLGLSLFGESHGPAVGVTLTGLPSGIALDMEAISGQMARRAPGRNAWSTPRKEADSVRILSGVYNGFTTGTPLCAVIENSNTRSGDYAQLARCPRPGHADYTASVRYRGYADPRGGGHFSARLTAPLHFAGCIARSFLAQRGITIAGHVSCVGGIYDGIPDSVHPPMEAMTFTAQDGFPAMDPGKAAAMAEAIEAARRDGDSLGGAVQVFAAGVPAGLGSPIFGGFESHFASLCYAVPAVKAVEFGAGCGFAAMKGSDANDSFCYQEGTVRTRTNHTGGINGGITNGMPIAVTVTFRPTPSISLAQDTVDMEQGTDTRLEVKGRHDPCIVARALPVVESVMALTIMDFLLEDRGNDA